MNSICVKAKLDNLPTVLEHVLNCAKKHGKADESKLLRLELIVEEVFVNICNYAYPDGVGDVEVACDTDSNALVIQFTDWGIPFDITSVPEPDVSKDVLQQKIGGLGVYFVKKFAKEVDYSRQADKNIVKISLKPL